MRNEISDAVKADLGRTGFSNWFSCFNAIELELEHAIKNLKSWASDKYVETPFVIGPGWSKIVSEPLGVVLVMGAWNYPWYTTISPLIPVIAAGNCAIIKVKKHLI